MSAAYNSVNTSDDENDSVSSITFAEEEVPSSSPPSFHSRASSPTAHQSSRYLAVDSVLVDAFDVDDVSDDDDDVCQSLVNRPTGGTPRTGETSSELTAPNIQAQTAIPPRSSLTPSRIYGSGIQSDGVFSNLSARPEVGDGTGKDEEPPTYEQAAADAAPPYWETTILAPGLGGPDEVYLDGMPVGSFFSFLWNLMVSMFFQLPGFVLTYLLHATHAAKSGSRAGLGLTLIQYGAGLMDSLEDTTVTAAPGTDPNGYSAPSDPNSHDFDTSSVSNKSGDSGFAGIPASEWLAYVLMVVGWLVLLRAASDYILARRHQRLVLDSPERHYHWSPLIARGELPESVV